MWWYTYVHCFDTLLKLFILPSGIEKVEVDVSSQKVMVTGYVHRNKILKAIRRGGLKADFWSTQDELLSVYASASYGSLRFNNFNFFWLFYFFSFSFFFFYHIPRLWFVPSYFIVPFPFLFPFSFSFWKELLHVEWWYIEWNRRVLNFAEPFSFFSFIFSSFFIF